MFFMETQDEYKWNTVSLPFMLFNSQSVLLLRNLLHNNKKWLIFETQYAFGEEHNTHTNKIHLLSSECLSQNGITWKQKSLSIIEEQEKRIMPI